jgi:nucleoside phosphorylase
MKSVGILVAMWEELNPLRKRWKLDWTGPGNFFTGKLGSLRVQVALSGVGARRAQQAVEVLRVCGRPDLLVSLGFSAGLRAGQQAGDCYLADSIEDPEGQVVEAPISPEHPRWRRGRLLCVDKLAASPQAKGRWAERHPLAQALDMESLWVARSGLPWVALRSLIDPLEEHLPLDLSQAMGPDGQVHSARLARQVLVKPHQWPKLLRFSQLSQRATRALVESSTTLMEVLDS